VAVKAPKPLVRIVDGALPEPLFRRLLAAVKRVGRENLADTWATTFWFPFDRPSALVEEAILHLRRHVAQSGIAGAEWWLSRMRTTAVGVDFHFDHDVAVLEKTGRLVHPRFSSVLYLNRARGGHLAVTAEPPNPRNPAHAPDRLEFDLVRPAPNRFAIFDGSLLHGVLDARGALADRILPGKPPLRLAIPVNWWTGRPRRVPGFAGSPFYRALAITGSARRGVAAPPRGAPLPRRRRSRARAR
jgi:hypothetical protein